MMVVHVVRLLHGGVIGGDAAPAGRAGHDRAGRRVRLGRVLELDGGGREELISPFLAGKVVDHEVASVGRVPPVHRFLLLEALVKGAHI